MRIDDLRVMGDREPIELQEEVTHLEQTRTFLSVKFPLIDENTGDLYGIGGVATDITHHVRLEARLREAQRLEAVGQLAGGVAHDFNNLLAVIANYAQFVRKELDDGSRAAGDVDQIISASRRASELTRRLLLFSRRQSGTPEVLSLRRVIESLELLLHRTLGESVDLMRRDRRPLVGRRGRPRPARATGHEPRHELARGDARRRHPAHRGRQHRHARPRRPIRPSREARRRRHRPRHGQGGRRPRLRAVLHHQGRQRPRRRAGTGHGLRHRHQGPRAHRARVRTGPGHDRHGDAARGPPRLGRRTIAVRTARRAARPSWSSRTPTPCGC